MVGVMRFSCGGVVTRPGSVADVVSWRGSREERSWPQRLRHSRTLPWAPMSDVEAQTALEMDPEGWES